MFSLFRVSRESDRLQNIFPTVLNYRVAMYFMVLGYYKNN